MSVRDDLSGLLAADIMNPPRRVQIVWL